MRTADWLHNVTFQQQQRTADLLVIAVLQRILATTQALLCSNLSQASSGAANGGPRGPGPHRNDVRRWPTGPIVRNVTCIRFIEHLCTLNGLKQTLRRRATVHLLWPLTGRKNIQYKIEERCSYFYLKMHQKLWPRPCWGSLQSPLIVPNWI